MSRRTRVAVVFGGRSSEHAISCVTAGSVLAALDRTRFEPVPVGITSDGRWVAVPDEPERLRIVDGVLPQVDPAGEPLVLAPGPGQGGDLPGTLAGVDVVFPLLHGPYGEDGTIQGLLELADLPYVGSGVLASAACMDKDVMKRLLASAGLPVGPHVAFTLAEWAAAPGSCTDRVGALGDTVFVKPARGGSSIGISRVDDPADLPAAVAEAGRWDPKLVVEAAVPGRELECGVLGGPGGGAPETSVPAEVTVVGDHDFYDFTAKYLDGTTRLDVPADLPEPTAAAVRRLAAAAFGAMGCEGLARVDFFCRPDGTLVVNEVNTMPGFTPTSMFPRMWAASGVGYAALVERLLGLALERPKGLR